MLNAPFDSLVRVIEATAGGVVFADELVFV